MIFNRPGRFGLGYLGILSLILPLLLACSQPNAAPTAAPNASSTPLTISNSGSASPADSTPPPANATEAPTTAPTAPTPSNQSLSDAVNQYVQAWQSGNYAAMYPLLSAASTSAIAQDKFVSRYTNIASGIDQISVAVTATVPSSLTLTGTPPAVAVPYQATYKLAVLGDVNESNQLPFVQENGAWKLNWSPDLIFKGLTATNAVQYNPVVPKRGSILDRNGNILAQDGPILIVGIVPGEIKDEATMLKAMSDYTQLPQAQIKALYANAQPDWFVPVKDYPATEKPNAQAKVGTVAGVEFQDGTRRVYPYGADAEDFVGYASKVTANDLKTLHAQGYDDGDLVGRAGLEAWGEQYLAGQKGATLAIANPDGSIVRVIAQKTSVPGANIQTTVDINYQIAANKILGTHVGSLIVMNPQDNSILAISSEPTFDPNLFIVGMTDAQFAAISGPSHPTLFRPAQGLYPTGSIFKVITFAAAMGKGLTKPTETFDCGLTWNGLPGVTLHNWEAQGTLNLIQSVTGSCDPTFYTLGLRLNQTDPNILPTYARNFGLGQTTGTVGIDDAAGLVPDPAWKLKNVGQPWYDGDGVNLAIGQGFLLATPLQMANLYSAIADGGTMRTPLLVASVKAADGTVVKSYAAESRGTLPISATNLGLLLQGMRGVTSVPLGTAYYAWKGSTIPMEAKTGSAENETNKAHAWFVGFTPPAKPTMLSLVMLEGGELGGQFAAPLGRQITEYALAHPIKPIAP